MKKSENDAWRSAIWRRLKKQLMWGILLLLIVIFAILDRNFLTWRNLINILNQNAYIIVVGVGVGMIMLSGGLDLSIGYQMSLNGVVMGTLMIHTNIPVVVVMLIGLVLGAFLSLVNGFLYVKLKVFPFIITLATMYMYQGLSYIITGSKNLTPMPNSFKILGQQSVGAIPIAIIIMVVVVLIGSFLLNKTYFGRYLYGLGGNQEAVRLAGVNTDKMYMIIYALTGVFVGLGTIMMGSRSGAYASTMGPGTEFTIIAGGMLGGIKMGGGGGSLSSVVVGVLIMALLSNGMQLMQLGTYPQYLVKGVVLIIAISMDTYRTLSAVRKAKHVLGSPEDE